MSDTTANIKKRHEEFSTKLLALVNEYDDVCAPSIDPVDEAPCQHDHDETCNCGVPTDTLLTEWSLVTQWVQLEGAQGCWTVGLHAPAMVRSHKVGLLTTALQML